MPRPTRKKKRSTRRSVSITGLKYQWLKDHCDEKGVSVSGFIEDMIADAMEKAGVEKPTVLRPREPSKTKKTREQIAGAHFSW